MGWNNEYNVKWFELMTYRDTRYCWYGVGPWAGHLMDWRGLNFHHGRIPDSPTFATIAEAVTWLQQAADAKQVYGGMRLGGHHSGEFSCSKGCDDREVGLVYIRSGTLDDTMRIDSIGHGPRGHFKLNDLANGVRREVGK